MSRGGRVMSRGGRHSNAAYANLHSEPRNFVRQQRSLPQRRRKVLGENTYRILIRESKVKVVLGPEGKHIKDIKNKCKEACKITIYTQHADGEPFPPNSPDRILNLECSFDDLVVVLTDLIPHLQVAPPDLMTHKFNEIRLVVPEFVCSMIIGKQGINVKNIQKDLRSFVQVHKEPLPYSTEYVVSLTNKDINSLAVSVIRIFESIQSIKSISHVTMFNPVVWYPGDFGDTGSYTEEMAIRPSNHNEPEEPRYYREQPRFHDDNRMPRQGFNKRFERNGDQSYEDYDRPSSSRRHQNPHSNGRGQNIRGQNMRGRNSYRGARHPGKTRGSPQNHWSEEREYHNRKTDYSNDHSSDDTGIPRRPKGIRGRGYNESRS